MAFLEALEELLHGRSGLDYRGKVSFSAKGMDGEKWAVLHRVFTTEELSMTPKISGKVKNFESVIYGPWSLGQSVTGTNKISEILPVITMVSAKQVRMRFVKTRLEWNAIRGSYVLRRAALMLASREYA